MRTLLPYAVAAASGVLLAFGYAPWEIEACAWIWMVPLLWVLWFTGPPAKPMSRAWRGARLGYVSGCAFFLINVAWLHTVTPPGAFILALYLAVYFGAWGAFAAAIGRPRDEMLATLSGAPEGRSLFAPAPGFLAGSLHNLRSASLTAAAWTSTEWLRGLVFTGFGWNGLGVALHENLTLIQIADIVGVTGISFLVMFCGCIAAGTLRRVKLELGKRTIRPHIDLHVTVIGVIAVFFYGVGRLRQGRDDTIPLRCLIVQPNIPIDDKWDAGTAGKNYQILHDLTNAFTAASGFDLVLWPETALYYDFFHELTQQFLNELLEGRDFHLILGTEENEPLGKGYNSVALLRGGTRDHQIHRKIHLVPFGEYIPLRKVFPPFEWIAGREVPADFSRGSSCEPLRLREPGIEIVPLICFEDTIGRLVRRFVTPHPQLIVNVTNDGWFRESSAAKQHLANARFRCIELKRPMARAANTGVSCFIDHLGSLHDRSQPSDHSTGEGVAPRGRFIHDHETGSHFVRGCLAGTIAVPRNPPITFYARFGDVFSQAALALTAAAVLVPFVRSRLDRRRGH